ncbi:two-component system response regulator PilR (NtrC family) [Desulfosalsimonas propionicica]|uniref:Two-component system response regulator PilR (NtrC family) n=1 Tax=Desulfosalsimonas propionicica TaxID=332175 RepID=A0A7W0C7A6_9BACT|nr:sigma-54 dependent transcriptional regulator [Desulfosalsimonas propionicica]MBA2880417.1 two-component system response regulator PilR (NtrC family) [Desulfosalsimonas propionicica]
MTEKATLLIVDDELSMREFLEIMLGAEGYGVDTAESGRRAKAMVDENAYDLVLCDIRLGDISGLEVLRRAKADNPDTVVIMISAYATAENAVEAMNEGAYDYLPKPFDNDELKQTVAKALELKTLSDEKKLLDDELQQSMHFGLLVGNSPRMMHIYEVIEQIAPTRTNVMITGESGTGKELIARAIHNQSSRSDRPFVVINCGSIPESLMESEFFGYKKGAFTGASQDKKGLFEAAHTGTIFLDEVGELSLPMQVRLLRVVQERSFKPVGSNDDLCVDIRIVSATNKQVEEEVIAGRFREDLYYRLNVVEIKVPPLRERKGDLRALAQHFLEKYARDAGKEMTKISSYAVDLLHKYDFPGNIRELENLIERSVALSSTNILLPDNLSLSIHKRRWIEGIENRRFDLDEVPKGVFLDSILEQIERAYLEKALSCTSGNKHKAAELLGITFRSFRYRCSKLGIEKPE